MSEVSVVLDPINKEHQSQKGTFHPYFTGCDSVCNVLFHMFCVLNHGPCAMYELFTIDVH